MPTPPTPVLSATSTTGRTVTLDWPLPPGLGPGPESMRIERSADGVTGWTEIDEESVYAPYHDRDLQSDTAYFHRIRVWHPTDGFGAYSNVTTTTTLGPNDGVVQYQFAVGAVGSFARPQNRAEDGTGSAFPAMFEVYGVFQLWGVVNPQESATDDGTNLGDEISIATHKIQLEYENGYGFDSVVVTSDYVLETQKIVVVSLSPHVDQVQARRLDNTFDIFGTLGSCDTLVKHHRADGFITVKLNNVVIFDVHGIKLGSHGTAGWSDVRFFPAGGYALEPAPGYGIQQNGGARTLYVGTGGEGSHDAFNYTFASFSTISQITGASAPWEGHHSNSAVDFNCPSLRDLGEAASVGKTLCTETVDPDTGEPGVAVGWMHLKQLITPPDHWGGGPPHVAPASVMIERPIRRLRRAPHVSNDNLRVFVRRFELDLERGQGLATGQGSDPIVMLRLSRDGGQTWGEEILMHAGALGAYTQRVIARRLGHARDTVFEVTVSDPIAWSLVGAWLDVEPGTS